MTDCNARWALTAPLLGALLAVSGLPGLAQAENDSSASVSVPVKLTQKISSDHASAGDRFSFVTTRAVQIGGLSVPAGTPGHGVVASVRAAKWDRGGDLQLQVESLDLPDGRTIPVTAPHGPKSEHQSVVSEAAQAAGDLKPANNITSALVPLTLPIRGIFMLGSALKIVKGHNVTFDDGTPFTVVAQPSA